MLDNSESLPRAPGPWRIRFRRSGSEAVHTVLLETRPLIIGRAAYVDIVLDSPTISRRHAEISRDPSSSYPVINDLGSRHGLLFGTDRITQRELEPGCLVQIGPFELWSEPGQVPHRPPMTTTAIDDNSIVADLSPASVPADVLTSILALSKTLQMTESPVERRSTLCEAIQAVFPGSLAAILCPEVSDPRDITVTTSFPEGSIPRVSTRLLTHVLTTGKPASASGATARADALRITRDNHGQLQAALACPIGRDEGATELLYVEAHPRYGTQDWSSVVALASDVFRQCEEAWSYQEQRVERAAFDRDLAQARQIQLSVLPTSIQVPGCDIAACYRACRSVGGDYYSITMPDDARVQVLLADVSGKGMGAALVTGHLHALVHSGSRRGDSIEALAATLNGYLLETLEDGMFVTMQLLELSLADDRYRALCAGHAAILALGPDCAVEVLPAGRYLPLGIAHQDFSAEEGAVDVGRTCVLYSDGVMDTRSPQGEWLGDAQFHAILRSTLDECDGVWAAGTLARSIEAQLDAFQAGAPREDDRTFVLVRRGS